MRSSSSTIRSAPSASPTTSPASRSGAISIAITRCVERDVGASDAELGEREPSERLLARGHRVAHRGVARLGRGGRQSHERREGAGDDVVARRGLPLCDERSAVISTLRAKVTAGRPRSSASAPGTAPVAPSVDSTPARTRSHGSARIARARTRAVTRASAPRSASSSTRTAWSAPSARARLHARTACAGPIDTAVTDPPLCSTSRAATASPGSSAGSRPPPGSLAPEEVVGADLGRRPGRVRNVLDEDDDVHQNSTSDVAPSRPSWKRRSARFASSTAWLRRRGAAQSPIATSAGTAPVELGDEPVLDTEARHARRRGRLPSRTARR